MQNRTSSAAKPPGIKGNDENGKRHAMCSMLSWRAKTEPLFTADLSTGNRKSGNHRHIATGSARLVDDKRENPVRSSSTLMSAFSFSRRPILPIVQRLGALRLR